MRVHWSAIVARKLLGVALWAVVIAVLFSAREVPTHLQKVKEAGVLRVAMVNSPTVYFQDTDGPTGFEYELVAGFARHLGVKLDVVERSHVQQVVPALLSHEADIVASGLARERKYGGEVRYGPSLYEVQPLVVYRRGTKRPRKLSSLVGKEIEVSAGSHQARVLNELRQKVPKLAWSESEDDHSVGLLRRVSDGDLKFTVADSHLVNMVHRYYTNLRVAKLNIGRAQNLAWAFRGNKDYTLYNASLQYFKRINRKGELANLAERFFGHVKVHSYANARGFKAQIRDRLPKLEAFFKEAAAKEKLDWRFLAAVGYQESHWDPDAVSPTGVRGVMMLTMRTARQMGVVDREDPRESIMGGARYIVYVKKQLPKDIPEPDRSWMTMAAYNMGLGHLIAARKITKEKGLNANRWMDVRDNIPLLAERRWYRKSKSGFARGPEAVSYVENIRGFYDILKWETRDKTSGNSSAVPNALPPDEGVPAVADDVKDPDYKITSPVL